MKIAIAGIEDVAEILSLQKIAYQDEAAIYQDYSLPPLVQTIDEIKKEFNEQLFLKVTDSDEIIGSVRAYCENSSCFIGRLIVNPRWQRKGVGTQLIQAVEMHFTDALRYELFTGTKSLGNIRLYKKLGYRPFKEKVLNDSVSLVFLQKQMS